MSECKCDFHNLEPCLCDTHLNNLFCGCDICERFKKLGFNSNQANMVIRGLRSAHMDGGDAGGPYSDFCDEALVNALDVMEEIDSGRLDQ